MKKNKLLFTLLIGTVILLAQPGIGEKVIQTFSQNDLVSQLGFGSKDSEAETEVLEQLKATTYDGVNQVIQVNEGKPTFTKDDQSLKNGTWETYSDLDLLNRVGVANAMLHKSMMPTEPRGDISSVRPTGFRNKKIMWNGHEDYLYNRSHLIGHQLTGQNANIKNLFTGTRSLNANFADEKNSMVYYENLIAAYLKETGNHVRYQVYPVFIGGNMVCHGVWMQAQSIEDNGISFNVFIFNVQEGYTINYLTGYSTKN